MFSFRNHRYSCVARKSGQVQQHIYYQKLLEIDKTKHKRKQNLISQFIITRYTFFHILQRFLKQRISVNDLSPVQLELSIEHCFIIPSSTRVLVQRKP